MELAKRKILCYVSLIFMLSIVSVLPVNFVEASNVGYSVIPQPSKKQVNNQNTYYDLKLLPGEKEKLKVTIKNNSDKAITIDTNVDKATTNSNGVVEYKDSGKRKSANLKYDIRDFAKPSVESVKLSPNESKEITYEVTQPKDSFDGVIAGGINFIQKNDDEGESSNKGGMSVKNQYGYSIALVLHGAKDISGHKVSADKLTLKQLNGRTNFCLPISNETASFLNKVNIKGNVYADGKVVYSDETSNAQIAPNSVYEYSIGTNQTKLAPGEYTAKVSVESKGENWAFTKDIKVSKGESEKLNKSAVIKDDDNNLYAMLAIGGSVLVAVVVILLLFLKNKEIKRLKKRHPNRH